MDRHDNEYVTADLKLACYLITEGFTLLGIEYQQNDGHQRGFFYFEEAPKRAESVLRFDTGEAVANLMQYEDARHDLLNRIKHGLP